MMQSRDLSIGKIIFGFDLLNGEPNIVLPLSGNGLGLGRRQRAWVRGLFLETNLISARCLLFQILLCDSNYK